MSTQIDQLATELGELLLKHKGLLATAESCTGGLLSGAATAIAGSSAWFDQGWVTYSNAAKQAQLGVTPQALLQFGAVSEEVARQMAVGVLNMAPRATLALTTTGIAGPGGGSPGKPVGLVWFGAAPRGWWCMRFLKYLRAIAKPYAKRRWLSRWRLGRCC